MIVRIRERSSFILGVLAVFILSAVISAADRSTKTESRLKSDIKYLASDDLEGRDVGSKGLNLAADFVAKGFREAGLDMTSVEGGPFHFFTMTTGTKLGAENSLQFQSADGNTIELKSDKDFHVCSFGGSGEISGSLVFGGYAIDAEDAKYRDFKADELKGKIVIIMRRTPQQGQHGGAFSGRSAGQFGAIRTKVTNAVNAGAAAILFVNDPYSSREMTEGAKTRVERAKNKVLLVAEKFPSEDKENEKSLKDSAKKLRAALKELKKSRDNAAKLNADPLMKFGYGADGRPKSVPILHITQAKCSAVLKAAGMPSLEQLEAEIDKDLKPRTAELKGWIAKGKTSVIRMKAKVKNVIGVLEGEGPLANETIVIGAHYDHVGMGGPGSLAPGSKDVHNGADDNASGTVSLMELARRLGSRKQKLPRRVVFIAFTAEERGLIGSARYVNEPVFPLDKTIAMYNMDMVGRMKDNKLIVYGTGTAPGFKSMVETYGNEYSFKLTLKPGGFGPSDQTSFYAKKIPVLHFFTGTHSDYHRPGDDWQKVNYKDMSRIVDMIEEIVVETAMAKDRPEYIDIPRARSVGSGNRAYLGSIPDFASDKKGYAIQGVAAGGPAEKAGMKGGDSIIKFGKFKINDINDITVALQTYKVGDTVDVTVLRDGKEVKLKVTLRRR